MLRVILLQVAATVVASAVGALVAGFQGSISSALGGLVCVLPNLVLALYLKVTGHRRSGGGFFVGFVFGELVKLALIVVLLYLIALLYGDLHLPSLLIGLAFATQALFLWGFWKTKS